MIFLKIAKPKSKNVADVLLDLFLPKEWTERSTNKIKSAKISQLPNKAH